MQVSIQADFNQLTKDLTKLQKKQIPFALSRAINSIAFQSQVDLKEAIPRYIDRPTKHTIKGVRYKKGNKKDPTAFVGFRSKFLSPGGAGTLQSDYMHYQVHGGRKLPQLGKDLAVPFPKHQKLNKYGNIKRTKIREYLRDSDRYFSGKPKGQSGADDGIWERMPPNSGRRYKWRKATAKQLQKRAGKIRMLVGWEPFAVYKKRLPMHRLISGTVNKHFKTSLEKELRNAIRTAK